MTPRFVVTLLLVVYGALFSTRMDAGEAQLGPPAKASGIQLDAVLTAKIVDALKEIQKLKAGMLRADVKELFVEEFGISNRRQRQYAYKKCPYIKVSVEFESAEGPRDLGSESSKDKIVNISAPFLQWTVID